MGFSIEEEAKRFIQMKQEQFIDELDVKYYEMLVHIDNNLHGSDEKEYAIKALKEAVLWCSNAAKVHGVK
jgi:hypothetical protein